MRTRGASSNRPLPAAQASGGTLVELIHELSRCHRLLRAWLDERLQTWGLREAEFWALWLCNHLDPSGVVQHELASAAGVSEAQMSSLVERLRQSGLLIGCRGQADRRRQYWRLTAAGDELLSRISAGLEKCPPDSDASPPREEQGTLWESVQRLARDLASAGTRGGTPPAMSDASRSKEVDDETSHRRAS